MALKQILTQPTKKCAIICSIEKYYENGLETNTYATNKKMRRILHYSTEYHDFKPKKTVLPHSLEKKVVFFVTKRKF